MNSPDSPVGSTPEPDRIGMLKSLRDLDAPIAERRAYAMQRFKETHSDGERNTAAIALADLGDPEAAKAIAEVIMRPGMAKSSGSLLYAVAELGGSISFDVFVHVLMEGSYEARHQALDLLDAGNVKIAEASDFQQGLTLLEQLRGSPDADGSAAAEEALSMLRQEDSTVR